MAGISNPARALPPTIAAGFIRRFQPATSRLHGLRNLTHRRHLHMRSDGAVILNMIAVELATSYIAVTSVRHSRPVVTAALQTAAMSWAVNSAPDSAASQGLPRCATPRPSFVIRFKKAD